MRKEHKWSRPVLEPVITNGSSLNNWLYLRGGQQNEFECSYDKDIDNLWSHFLFMCSLEPFFYYRFFPSHWFPRLWTSQLESQLERVTALTWTIISSIYRYLVHFCQIRIGKQVTFWTNVKQSRIEHNTSLIKYSQTPPTQNKYKILQTWGRA